MPAPLVPGLSASPPLHRAFYRRRLRRVGSPWTPRRTGAATARSAPVAVLSLALPVEWPGWRSEPATEVAPAGPLVGCRSRTAKASIHNAWRFTEQRLGDGLSPVGLTKITGAHGEETYQPRLPGTDTGPMPLRTIDQALRQEQAYLLEKDSRQVVLPAPGVAQRQDPAVSAILGGGAGDLWRRRCCWSREVRPSCMGIAIAKAPPPGRRRWDVIYPGDDYTPGCDRRRADDASMVL